MANRSSAKIYFLLICLIPLISAESALYENFQQKLNNVSDNLELKYQEKFAPKFREYLQETSNLFEEAYDDFNDQENSNYQSDHLKKIYEFAQENPESLKRYLKSKKMKRELSKSPQKIANDLIDHYDGEYLVGNDQNTYNKLLNQLKQKFYDPSASAGNLVKARETNSTDILDGKFNQTFGSDKILNQPQGSDQTIGVTKSFNESESCSQMVDPTNATAVLEKVLEELEMIRLLKQGNSTPEGSACEIEGSWNSEIIGLRFDFNLTNDNRLKVGLADKVPQKHSYKIDKTWNCTGLSLNKIGGPFYLTCLKNHDPVLAIFTGICKNCGGYNTIFGSWNFAHVPKDCQDLHTFVETKNDVFRHETLHLKKIEKLAHKDVIQQNTEPHPGNKTRRFVDYFRNYGFD